ncbi:unnamed protein product [Linum trigynum]|uniref:Uncharacterized protein n=1 Tax=Linum trigynum TaxID=586398 RepID=A0AAV2E0H3_9ROSI
MILEPREKEKLLLLSSTSQSSRSTAGAPPGQSIEGHQLPLVAANLGFGRWILRASNLGFNREDEVWVSIEEGEKKPTTLIPLTSSALYPHLLCHSSPSSLRPQSLPQSPSASFALHLP